MCQLLERESQPRACTASPAVSYIISVWCFFSAQIMHLSSQVFFKSVKSNEKTGEEAHNYSQAISVVLFKAERTLNVLD